MNDGTLRGINYCGAIIHAAQYLSSMRPGADRWVEFGLVVRRFFSVDLVAVAYRLPDHRLAFHYTSLAGEEERVRLLEAVGKYGRPVLNSGFLSTEFVALPEPYSIALLPLAEEQRIDTLLVVGHKGKIPLASEMLDTYLAVARLMESTLARLSFEEQLRLRAREQAGIAFLGHRALEGDSIDSLMEEAVKRVGEIMESDYCALLELMPEGTTLLLRAGYGWKENFVGRATIDAAGTKLGSILHSRQATVENQIDAGDRLAATSLFLTHTIVSSAAVALRGRKRPLGIMSVHTVVRRDFTEEELTFLQTAADVIAAAWERKQAEGALRESEVRLRALFEHARDGIVVLEGESGHIVDCNSEFARMTGRSREELLQMAVWALCPSADQARTTFRPSEWTAETGCTNLDFMKPDGTRVPVEFSSRPLTIGGRLYIQSICRDITERKRAEEALRAREEEFRALVEHSPDVIVRFDRSLRRIYANPAIADVLGRPLNAIVGKTNREVGVPEAAASFWDAHINEVFASGREGRMETVMPTRDRTLYLESRLVPEFGLDGRVETVLGITRDITARKQAEEALRKANDELKKALEDLRATQQQMIQSEKLAALGTLAAGVAHELNNPMMGVMGYVTFAREEAREPEAKQLLEKALRELGRMRDLLKSMLGFARPTEGQLTLVDIGVVLERALALIQPDLKAKGITVVTDLPAELPPVTAHAGFLQQVFLNLLLNARDALEGRPLRVIRIDAHRQGDTLLVRVADTGPGVPPELLGRVFDPFITTKPPGQGTGLGLPIARNIVADFGGSITYETREEGGAIFTVALPLAREPH